jgi:Protein of unknown function (DUF1214)
VSSWAEDLETFGQTAELMTLLERPDDPQLTVEAHRLFYMALASGWFTAFSDPDFPDFVPAVNTHLNAVGTNPDFIYGAASIDGNGTYLISGERGDGLFVMLDIVAGGLGVMEQLGPSLGTLDFDMLAIDDDLRFEVMLSTKRPDGWNGNWHPLDPSARSLSLRQASYDWGKGREARIAIERMDKPHTPRRWSSDEIAERLSALAGYPKRLAGMALGFLKTQRDKGLWNALEHDDWAGRGGVQGQHYYQGLFRLEPGQVLLLETELPETVRYWNVQLSDMMWNSIDWMNRQSSLNGGQAQIDDDGKFRAVIAADDPEVPNWLDTGGNHEGAIMLRWTGASSGPAPTLTIINVADLSSHLPTGTPVVSKADREEALRVRRRSVQWRRRW